VVLYEMATGLLAVVGALAWWFLSSRTPDAPAAPIKITPFTTDGGAKSNPQLSPDGEKVAYEWAGPADDNWDVYVKALGVGAGPLRLTKHPAGRLVDERGHPSAEIGADRRPDHLVFQNDESVLLRCWPKRRLV
jgi:hypothetical protein